MSESIRQQLAQAEQQSFTAADAQSTAVVENQVAEAQATAEHATGRNERGALGRKFGTALGGLILVGGAVGGGIYLTANGSESETNSDKAPSAADVAAACGDSSMDSKLTENLDAYSSTAFLPKAEVANSNETQQRISGDKGYFKSSPLGTSIDAHSLSALNAVVTIPATDKKPSNADGAVFIANYETTLKSLKGEGGLDKAKELCENTFGVMVQSAEYNSKWASKGDSVVLIEATRNKDGDKNNDIDCMTLVEKTAPEDLEGIELKPQESGKDMDGFESILIDDEGNMWIKGVTVPKEKETKKEESKENKGATGGNGNSTGGQGGGGNAGGNTSTGGGEGGSCGGNCSGGGGSSSGGGSGGGGGGGCGGNCGGGGGGGGGNPPQPPVTPPPPVETPPTPKGEDPGCPVGAPCE